MCQSAGVFFVLYIFERVTTVNIVKIAILGLGQVGLRHFRAFSSLENCEVAAVVDMNQERAGPLANEHGLRAFSNHKELLKSDLKIDAVVNALPHHLHYKVTQDLAEAGLHVLLEKPMCLNLFEADELIKTFKKRGLKLGIGYVHRFRQEVLDAKKIIDNGELGMISFIADYFCSQGGSYVPDWVWKKECAGGGVLMYGGVHVLDRMRWFIGVEPVAIYAHVRTFSQPVNCEDGLAAVVEFQNGVVGNLFQISPGFPALRGWETKVVGAQGMLKIEIGKSLEVSTTKQKSIQEYSYGFDHFIAQARDFVGAIIEDREPWITGEDGRQSLAFALALYRSAELGRPVKVPEVYDK